MCDPFAILFEVSSEHPAPWRTAQIWWDHRDYTLKCDFYDNLGEENPDITSATYDSVSQALHDAWEWIGKRENIPLGYDATYHETPLHNFIGARKTYLRDHTP